MSLTKKILEDLNVDTKKDNYKILCNPTRKTQTDKYVILEEGFCQMDLFFMPSYNGFKYVINIVDMYNKVTDVQPIRTKSAKTICSKFIDILEREIVKPKVLYCDQGSEFNNKQFIDLCKDEDIKLIFTRVCNHKQNAYIEAMNGVYKRILMRYISYMKLEKKKEKANWVEKIFKVRDELNKHYSEQPKTYSRLLERKHFDQPKFKYNDRVRIKLDYPRDNLDVENDDDDKNEKSKKMFAEKFRHGNHRFSQELYYIDGIKDCPCNNGVRYYIRSKRKGDPLYGTFAENDLMSA